MKTLRHRPADGGQLMPRLDASIPSFQNYTRKLDFRRDLDQEMRREGHSPFQLITSALGNQHRPQEQAFPVAGFANGGFEIDDDDDGVPDDWDESASGATWSLDLAADYTEGEQSIKCVSTNVADTATLLSSEYLAVTAGYLWNLKVAAKVSNALMIVRVDVLWYDSDFALLNQTSTPLDRAAGSTDWTEYPLGNLTPPSTAAYGKIKLYGHEATETIGSIWWDGVTLTTRDSVIRPINLIHHARRPNGQTALIVGTATTLYRFYSYSGRYVSDVDGGDYITQDPLVAGVPFFDVTDPYYPYTTSGAGGPYVTTTGYGTPYFSTAVGLWQIIGSGYSENGRRWEAVTIDGYSVFNNGTDLPVSYRVEDTAVKPLYELREQGVAYVGTIAEINSVLMCGDIGVIKDTDLAGVFAHESGGTAKVRQNGAYFSAYPATGAQGYAVRFDGSNDYIAASGSGTLNVTGAALTLEVTFRISASATGSSGLSLIYKDTGGALPQYSLSAEFDTDGNVTIVGMAAGSISVTSESFLNLDTWYHVALVTDGSSLRLYLNGQLDATEIAAVSISTSAAAFAIGRSNNGTPADYFHGDITEVRVWNVARTPAQILAKRYDSLTASATGLVGYWKLDEGSGTSAADSSGDGNNGTLTGGPTWITSDSPADAYVYFDEALDTVLDNPGACVGRLLRFSNGVCARVVAHVNNYAGLVVDATKSSFKVDGSVADLIGESLYFWIVNDIEGEEFAVTRLSGSNLLTGTDLDSVGYVGMTVKITDGTTTDYGRILQVKNSDTELYLDQVCTASGNATVTAVSDYTMFCDEEFFTRAMVGRKVFLDNGQERKITRYVSEQVVEVDSFRDSGWRYALENVSTTTETVGETFDSGRPMTTGERVWMQKPTGLAWMTEWYMYFVVNPVGDTYQVSAGSGDPLVSGAVLNITDTAPLTVSTQTFYGNLFSVENNTAYGRLDDSIIDRIHYRALWGQVGKPRRFAAAVPGSINAGQRKLELDYPARGFEVGMEITITGAGAGGGNLTADITLINENLTTLSLSVKAEATTDEAMVQASDAANSIAGFYDLAGDSSAIVKMLELDGRLVIYKAGGAITVATYLGAAAAPFDFSRRDFKADDAGQTRSVFYRNTLVCVGGEYHCWASNGSFYRFDLTRRAPVEMPIFEHCKNLFFDQARRADTERVFAGQNGLTKEVFFCFPSTSETKGLALDYYQNTVSELGAAYTSVATVQRPTSELGEFGDDMCVLGDDAGQVLIYGKSNEPQDIWGGATEIYNRSGSGITSKLRGGLLGDGMSEILLSGYLLEMGTQSLGNGSPVTINFYGYRNTSEQPKLKGSVTRLLPSANNLIKAHLLAYWLQDEIVVTGQNNPFRIAARTMVVGALNSMSQGRRE